MRLKSKLKLVCGVTALLILTVVAVINKYTPLLRSPDEYLIVFSSRLASQAVWLMTAISAAASIYCVWTTVLLLLMFSLTMKILPKHIVFQLVAVLAATEVLNALIKLLVGVPRPLLGHAEVQPLSVGNVLHIVSMMSFPSGHVARFTVLSAYLGCTSKAVAVLLYVLLLLVAVSRVLLRSHYCVDVVGGFLLGIGTSLTINSLLTNYRKR
ncbi:MAG: phosphatase PAP2 family protein [Desulfurococcales archaeon]|nr:phosphatase PAP2 family protein [Desulfurococcales archaeon]